MHSRNRSRKILASTLVVGVLGSLSTLGVFGAFSATTQNAGNEISTGTVALGDNDAGSAMFSVANAKPGDVWVRCIKVTYSGGLPSNVHMYSSGTGGALTPYLALKLEAGQIGGNAEPFPSCTGFTPATTGGTLHDGPMTTWAASDYESGKVLWPAGATAWSAGDSVVVRMTLALATDIPDTSQSADSGVTSIAWEARNQ
jgi:hypothetical protein